MAGGGVQFYSSGWWSGNEVQGERGVIKTAARAKHEAATISDARMEGIQAYGTAAGPSLSMRSGSPLMKLVETG